GEAEAAERFRQETVEELRHAERLVQRMLQLGVAPAASQLRPVGHAADLLGLLRLDADLERDLIQHYAEATRFCLLIGDHNNEVFFRTLRDEEQQHGDVLAAWLDSLGNAQSRSLQRATF
ncbi:ferritin-like domain-containing protein, partial [Cyanobium sp. N5-Cardenillas]|uniref:ferritin-like domain-containing protein n=1 Tax=Cyanobium sp. N5-Cardenillas TaxID=2823720 RepID=UPI0020CE0728